jgi:hypothetical protein
MRDIEIFKEKQTVRIVVDVGAREAISCGRLEDNINEDEAIRLDVLPPISSFRRWRRTPG